MKLTRQQYEDLCIMIVHSKIDMSFGEGGSFICEDKKGEWVTDKKEAKQVERAIKFLLTWIKKSGD